MTDWPLLLADDHALRAHYGAVVPSLQGVHVHELRLHRDGPSATLRFDLAEYPAAPPAKWRSAGFDRVQLTLTAIVVDLAVRGWGTDLVADLALAQRDDGLIDLRGTADGWHLEITARALLLDSVSAYRDGAAR